METANNISLTLYQPDIPQNVGAAMRLCACMGIKLNLIEPFGFPWKEREFKRIGMDYINLVEFERYSSWEKFQECFEGRIVLMTTKASVSYTDFEFNDGDTLMAGRESIGAPEEVHASADGRVLIPMRGKARSLNIINACAMITGEALRQVNLK